MKKILICLLLVGIICGSITGCMLFYKQKCITDNEEENKIEIGEQEEIEADSNKENTEPATKKLVVIDPGHGSHSNMEKEKLSPDSNVMKIKDGGGAKGVKSGTPEYVIAMKVSLKLKDKLEKNNFAVIMTKTNHNESPGNIERAEVANSKNANLEIRIHCDSSKNKKVKGASMLVPAKVGYATPISEVSKKYGQTILEKLVGICKMPNRGIIERGDITGFNWSKVPNVLVEMGFMSNLEEDSLLNDDGYEEKLAEGLCQGITEALN